MIGTKKLTKKQSEALSRFLNWLMAIEKEGGYSTFKAIANNKEPQKIQIEEPNPPIRKTEIILTGGGDNLISISQSLREITIKRGGIDTLS